jgi:hypothetical protein
MRRAMMSALINAVDGIAFVDNLAEKRHGQTTL